MTFFKEEKYEGTQTNSTFKPYYSIKDGAENIFRIAPSCRNLPSGEFAVYNKIHFGYSVVDSSSPDKTRKRPFGCVAKYNYKTKKNDVECAECLKIEEVKAEMEELKQKLAKQGHDEEYINQAVQPQMDWLKQHNLDNKWYCYAKTPNGEWNILKIGHKVKLGLDELMKRLFKEDKIRALDPNGGVWFKFSKNGLKGSKALTTVEVLREKTEINGQRVEIIKPAPLTEQDVKGIEALADVTDCFPKLTPEQVSALVASAGDPNVATSIFALGQKATPPVQSYTAANSAPAPASAVHVPTPTPAAPAPNVASLGKPVDMAKDGGMTPEEFLRKFASQRG